MSAILTAEMCLLKEAVRMVILSNGRKPSLVRPRLSGLYTVDTLKTIKKKKPSTNMPKCEITPNKHPFRCMAELTLQAKSAEVRGPK